eukprot:919464-Pelagomonas_calceolata.AAC.1
MKYIGGEKLKEKEGRQVGSKSSEIHSPEGNKAGLCGSEFFYKPAPGSIIRNSLELACKFDRPVLIRPELTALINQVNQSRASAV